MAVTMNSRDVTLISSAALIGAVTSSIFNRYFFSNPKQKSSLKSNEQNRTVADPYDPSKRQGYITWNNYFMSIAFHSAQRSNDPIPQLNSGKVVDVGPEPLNKNGQNIPVAVKEGELFLLPEYGGTSLKLGEKDCYVLVYKIDEDAKRIMTMGL